MKIGDELIYRAKESDPSQRVQLLAVEDAKRPVRYRIAFPDAAPGEEQELCVPGVRLRGPWASVYEYDAMMANWQRLRDLELTEAEEDACNSVFDELVPAEVASIEWKPVKRSTRVSDRAALAELATHDALGNILETFPTYDSDEGLILSVGGTLALSESIAAATATAILDIIEREEREYRERSKHGHSYGSDANGEKRTTDPAWEYEWYLQRIRPMHEILRSWCGHRAITAHERLAAAEAEAKRLEEVVSNVITELRLTGHTLSAREIARELEEGRITAWNYRPVVERPLRPDELRVEYVTRPRR